MKAAFSAALLIAATSVLPTAPAPAQVSGRALTIYGNDPCPRDTICVRAPESERYRIPERLRKTEDTPARESWAERASSISQVGRTGIGSCTPSGTGGDTGCTLRNIERARAERAQQEGEAPVLE